LGGGKKGYQKKQASKKGFGDGREKKRIRKPREKDLGGLVHKGER